MPSYTLEIEAFGIYTTNMPSLEIWEDGILDSTHTISSSGSTISLTINYGGSLPTSLSLTFNDAFAAAGRTIEIRSVKINDKHVNVGNYLSADSLTKSATATVDIANSSFFYDSSDPALSEFTTGATRIMTIGNDTLRTTTSATPEILDALAGRDVFYLGTGNDKVFGNAGDDIIHAGAGDDLISGGDNDDRLYGEDGNDRLYGGNGNDRIYGGDGDDEIHGGAGDDNLFGHDGNDVITGGIGADKLNGGDGDDYLFGEEDNDNLVGAAGNDTLDGGAGNDVIYGGDGDDIINGGIGDDVLIGNIGMDTINGDAGNDTIYLMLNDFTVGEKIYGGAGTDELILTKPMTIDFTTGVIDGLETLTGSDDNQDVTYTIQQALQFSTIDLAGGTDNSRVRINGTVDVTALGTPTVSNVENGYLTGSAGADTLTISGAQLNALVYGSGIIDFGASADVLNITSTSTNLNTLGSTANASIVGLETISASTAVDAVTIDLSGQLEDFTVTGSDNDDSLTMGAGDDTVNGGLGNDTIYAQNGGDTVNGGNGNDKIYGDIGGINFSSGLLVIEAENYETRIDRGGQSWNTVDDVSASGGQVVIAQPNTGTIYAGTGIENTSPELTYTVNFTATGTFYVWIKTGVASGGSDDSVHLGFDGVQQTGSGGVATGSNYGWHNTETGTGTVVTVNVTTTGIHTLNLWMREDGSPIDKIIIADNPGYTPAGLGPEASIRTSSSGGNDVLNGNDGDDLIYGDFGNDTLNGGNDNDTLIGGVGIDTINGDNGNDTINLANGDFAAGESLTGGAGTDNITLTNATTVDFSTGTLATIEVLNGSTGNDDVTYTIQQALTFTTIDLGAGTDNSRVKINGTVNATILGTPTVTNAENGFLTGSTGNDTLTITGAQLDALIYGSGTIDFAAGTDTLNITTTSADLNSLGSTANASIVGLETISASTAGAGVTINLSAQTEAFTITGSTSADTITGGTGADIINSGNGNDTINLANGHFAAGESLTGGAGTDNITLTNATTVDFSTGTIATIEVLNGSTGNDDITYTIQQALAFTTIDLGAGTDNSRVKITGVVDATALGTPTVTNAENGFLTGSTGNDTLTITGAQIDALIYGSGTIDFAAGTDTLNITTTSADLNSLGSTANASIVGLETISASTAGAGVTINLSAQTEAFTITGSTSADTITGGTGADIINSGNGNDTINLANGHFAAGESLTGGAGTDNITLTNATTVDFTTGTLATIEVLNGSTGNDVVTISGTQLNSFTTLSFNGGTDTLNITSTSTGLNALNNASITGLENISASTAAAGVTINMSAQTENFTITGSASADLLYGGSGIDTLNGGASDDFLNGGASADVLNGDAGADVLIGADGADTLNGGIGNDVLHGGGLTTAEISALLTANPSIVFNSYTNSFYQYVTTNVNYATAQANAAAATLSGIAGHLVNITSAVENTYVFNLTQTNTSTDYAWIGGNDLSKEAVWRWQNGAEAGTQFWQGNQTGAAVGNQYTNFLGTNPQGGTGENGGIIVVNAGGGADSFWADQSETTTNYYVIEWDAGLISDDNAIDTLNGGDGNDILYGYGGNDILYGDANNDVLYGGAGNDTLNGGSGNDVLYGGAGNDTIYGDGTAAPTATSTQGWSYQYYDLAGSPNTLSEAGFTLNSGRDNNLISTSSGITQDTNPAIFDAGDNYALKFETTLTINTAGTYTFRTASDDGSQLFLNGVLIVDNGGLHGTVTVTSAGQALAAGTYTLEAIFFEKTGGNTMDVTMSGPDTSGSYTNLENYVRANVVTYSGSGSDGNDLISGGLGTDILYGGGGADTFIFEAASAFAQTDTIMDFSTADGDKIDISDIITGTFSGNIKDYLQFTSSGGGTLVQVDANGTTGGTSFQTIARIDGLVGLDESTLYANGHIII